jgi:hypothetical protein
MPLKFDIFASGTVQRAETNFKVLSVVWISVHNSYARFEVRRNMCTSPYIACYYNILIILQCSSWSFTWISRHFGDKAVFLSWSFIKPKPLLHKVITRTGKFVYVLMENVCSLCLALMSLKEWQAYKMYLQSTKTSLVSAGESAVCLLLPWKHLFHTPMNIYS